MKYRLLDNQTGVIVGRNPVLLQDKLSLSFPEVTGKLMVALENQGEFYYRELQNAHCELNAGKLRGVVKVTLFDNMAPVAKRRKWVCEELYIDRTENGVWVYPNDANLPQAVIDLRLENEQIRHELTALRSSFKALEERFERLMEGYDIT
ncbi:MAG: hypothetical protein IKA46_02895 [Clostridia bacterium]|nr:hypothetical protein [Clostridia bacterium]MBR3862734.1 hypothetical protein [Clostridia bacterium]